MKVGSTWIKNTPTRRKTFLLRFFFTKNSYQHNTVNGLAFRNTNELNKHTQFKFDIKMVAARNKKKFSQPQYWRQRDNHDRKKDSKCPIKSGKCAWCWYYGYDTTEFDAPKTVSSYSFVCWVLSTGVCLLLAARCFWFIGNAVPRLFPYYFGSDTHHARRSFTLIWYTSSDAFVCVHCSIQWRWNDKLHKRMDRHNEEKDENKIRFISDIQSFVCCFW